MPQSQLLIGWGEADITPNTSNVELAGQYYQRIAKGIHSRIATTALAFDNGTAQAVMVSLDVVSFNENLQITVRNLVAKQLPDINPECVFLNAIHTHSAPYTQPSGLFRNWLPLSPDTLDPAVYVNFLTTQILTAITQAWNNRKPGKIQPQFTNARIGHCRRAVYSDGTAEMYGDTSRDDFVGMEAGEDSGVEMLFTFDMTDAPTGLVLNVPCPSQVMEATYFISSDYMGATREHLKKHFGHNFHTLCQISAAGCQSPRDLSRNGRTEPDFWHADGVTEISQRLFNAIMNPTFKGDVSPNPPFKHTWRRVQLPIRRASYEDYVKAQHELKRLLAIMPEKEAFDDFCRETHANEKIPGRPGPYDSKLHHFVLIANAKAVIKRYETQDSMPPFSYNMQSIRLADCAFVNLPFELYLIYGQMIKARSKARQSFIIQLSGGSAGYLPSKDAERFGGYGGLIINGIVGADGGLKLVDLALDAINHLF